MMTTTGLPKPKHRHLALAVVLLLAAVHATAYEATYLPAANLDLVAFLAPPPSPGSAEAAADLAAMLAAQAARTPATAAAARADAEVSVFRFADVLGPDFNPQRAPSTAAFFKAVGRDATQIGRAAKAHWQRPRPAEASARVQPIVDFTTRDAYPSGHAMYGCLTAVLLGELVPERRTELLARGRSYAWNRVVGGVHYPTDVEAGCLAGKLVAAAMLQSPRFRADLATAREETRRALALPAAAEAEGS